jgi:hypothetical protein
MACEMLLIRNQPKTNRECLISPQRHREHGEKRTADGRRFAQIKSIPSLGLGKFGYRRDFGQPVLLSISVQMGLQLSRNLEWQDSE